MPHIIGFRESRHILFILLHGQTLFKLAVFNINNKQYHVHVKDQTANNNFG